MSSNSFDDLDLLADLEDGPPISTFYQEDDDADVQKLLAGEMPDPGAFLRPVGITFIGTVLGIEPRRLHKKLAKCPIVGRGTNGRGAGQPLYDFKEAMRYCVEPKIDLKTWFSSLSTTTMPPIISKAFWEGIRAKNKAMEESGHYWHTEDVLRVFGETAMTIKNATLLWIEELPGKVSMSNEDYHALRRQVNELLKTLQQQLVDHASDQKTESVATALEREMEEGLLDRVGGVGGE